MFFRNCPACVVLLFVRVLFLYRVFLYRVFLYCVFLYCVFLYRVFLYRAFLFLFSASTCGFYNAPGFLLLMLDLHLQTANNSSTTLAGRLCG